MGIMLLGVFIPLHDVWHGQAHSKNREADALQRAQRSNVKGVGRDLLQSIARLDDAYEHGMLDVETYQQRRQAYKAQLCKLIEEIQRSEVRQKAIEMRRSGA